MELINKKPKIYIVCGKARYGKDTTAEIIKGFYDKIERSNINLQYSSYIKGYAKKISNWDGSDETKPRKLLQKLGTEIIRNKIDNLFFVKRIIDDIRVYSYFFDVITISDARAKVEVDSLKKNFANVIAIHLNRPNFDNGLTEAEKKHFTEIDLDDYEKYDFYVENNGTINDLKQKIEKILVEVEKSETFN